MLQSKCQQAVKSIALIGSHLPRRCGIAVFTADLCDAVDRLIGPDCQVSAVAANDTAVGYHYPPRVRFQIAANEPADYRFAAEFLNMHEVDAAVVQHEFGIYGGPAGSNILRLLRELRMPVVVTLHNVPDAPSAEQRATIHRMAQLVDRFVVTAQSAGPILAEVYGIDPERTSFIPYGIPDMPLVDRDLHREDLGLADRQVILSFGLLSPNKGIENMIRAMPAVVERHPQAIYVILGITHPHVKLARGQEYRQNLYHLVRELDLEEHVTFRGRFVGPEELEPASVDGRRVRNALFEPVADHLRHACLRHGAGAAVVSTPFRYAREMLADQRGCLVPAAEPDALAESVNGLLDSEAERGPARPQCIRLHPPDDLAERRRPLSPGHRGSHRRPWPIGPPGIYLFRPHGLERDRPGAGPAAPEDHDR